MPVPRTARLAAFAAVLFFTSIASARVLSYSPYTDRVAVPAIQHRMNRYFVLVEGPTTFGAWMPFIGMGMNGQVVIYDSSAQERPRVVFPHVSNSLATISVAAVREDSRGVLTILIQTTFDHAGTNPNRVPIFLITSDSGATWNQVPGLGNTPLYNIPSEADDVGGPFARSRYSPVRIATESFPFVVSTGRTVYAVSRDGGSTELYIEPLLPGLNSVAFAKLAGSNSTGTEFLIHAGGSASGSARESLHLVSLAISGRTITPIPFNSQVEGWITPSGDVYYEQRNFSSGLSIVYADPSRSTELLKIGPNGGTGFAVPSNDYATAWIVSRVTSQPTIFLRHGRFAGSVKQWEDVTAPLVEALHAGSSGTKLLVQVHKPRPQMDQRLFVDPALAIWNVGDPPPRTYDELFMHEELNKGFVHLDVDRVENGDPFVFDSGTATWQGGIISSPGGGGGDVVQEWGVVRSSLKQRLILPGVARTEGAYGAFWVSDVVLHNPYSSAQTVRVRFVPTGNGAVASATQSVALGAREIRLVPDVLKTLFAIERGGGSIIVEPDASVTVTSRTYSRSDLGSFGFGINAIDAFTAPASPRFALTYAGAFPAINFRTNVTLTDAFNTGALATLTAAGISGAVGRSDVSISATAEGQSQMNNLADTLGLAPWETGALTIRSERGSGIASVITIDNVTNDATYFGPDLPSPIVRSIPMIAHQLGANGADFRSDLYLFNPSPTPRMVTLRAKSWDRAEAEATLNLTLLPSEARVIKDVLLNAFGKTGAARLRYSSPGDASGVRITSRTYSLTENGGTYGFPVPPLNNFQIGTSGDTLEILGSVADPSFRTNIGLVEMTAFGNTQTASVKVEIVASGGTVADSFVVSLPIAGGMQINDVFRSRSVNVEGPVLIRISPQSGTVGAYAAMIDNRTNDATYLSANLGASE
ncbi:MAG: hypothetical protein JJE51_00875 [Thermoanaerobaculia bacterium]|nr:hypothetical protein [Thermoanaerobaculia bacterium]